MFGPFGYPRDVPGANLDPTKFSFSRNYKVLYASLVAASGEKHIHAVGCTLVFSLLLKISILRLPGQRVIVLALGHIPSFLSFRNPKFLRLLGAAL